MTSVLKQGIGTVSALVGLALLGLFTHAEPTEAAVADVQPVMSWVDLGPITPLEVTRSTSLRGPVLASALNDPTHIALCSTDGIHLSSDGAATWRIVDTRPIVSIAAASPYPLLSLEGSTPLCSSLALDPSAPDSVYAAFQAGKAEFGAPPIVFVGYVTTDAGRTWQPVPDPAGTTSEAFGGFAADDAGVSALFRAPTDATPFLEQRSVDGGHTWMPVVPTCPEDGACVSWGPAPNVIGSCSMAERLQAIMRSDDAGQTWNLAPIGGPGSRPGGANACEMNELISISPAQIVLISSGSENAVQQSSDSGLTWSSVTVPPVDGASHPALLRGLQVLPDGSLIALTQDQPTWSLLAPGASEWCPVSTATRGARFEEANSARVIGDRLWWVGQDASSANSVPLSELRCPTSREGAVSSP